MSGVFQFVEFDKRAPPSCAIMYLFPNAIPKEMLDIQVMMHTTWFTITRMAAAHVDNMRHGYVLVEDFKDVSLSHLLHLASDSSRNKKQMDSIQGNGGCFCLVPVLILPSLRQAAGPLSTMLAG